MEQIAVAALRAAGLDVLPWRERIIEAETRPFSRLEREMAEDLPLCAVGEAVLRLRAQGVWCEYSDLNVGPRACEGVVARHFGNKSSDFMYAGGLFPWALREKNLAGAHAVLDLIEARALEIKRAAGTTFGGNLGD